MPKETTEISLVGTLHRIEDRDYLAYQFKQKDPSASMTLTMEVDDPSSSITGLIYDNAKVTVLIEVDLEADFIGRLD